jgi:hypothetical protein
MAKEKATVKGGFRSTLALLISIVALILAFIAFDRTGGQTDLENRVKELNARLKTMRQESSDKIQGVLQETSKALEKLGVQIEKKSPTPEAQKPEQEKPTTQKPAADQ